MRRGSSFSEKIVRRRRMEINDILLLYTDAAPKEYHTRNTRCEEYGNLSH